MADWKYKRGLTLVEILVVLAVIAALAAMIIKVTLRVENQSSENIVANAFSLLKSALREYYEYTDKFPLQPDQSPPSGMALAHIQSMYRELDAVPASREILKGIDTVLVQRHDKQPATTRLYDPWGTPLNYIYVPGDTFPELVSAGPDKTFGTADDISSKGT